MMGTPEDLSDFAIGFSLSEGIVQSADEIETLDIVELDDGIELRMWLAPDKADAIGERRRHIAGPTGCGICGVEFDCGGRQAGGDRAKGARLLAAGNHEGDGGGRPAAGDQPPDPRGACRRVLDAGPRHRQHFARMSAATTHSTSSPVHWRGTRSRPATAWCCSPAASPSRWCKRPPRSARR